MNLETKVCPLANDVDTVKTSVILFLLTVDKQHSSGEASKTLPWVCFFALVVFKS